MKILTNEQMHAADQQTIEEQQITSWDHMEKAASNILAWIKKNLPGDNPYHIYAGVGNNGGDGLALGRMLAQMGKKVKVTIVPKVLKSLLLTNIMALSLLLSMLFSVLGFPAVYLHGYSAYSKK